MSLTTPERAGFSAAQLAELDRMADARLEDDYLAPANVDPADLAQHRTDQLASFAALSASQLKARVNIASTGQSTVNFAPENDYDAAEQQEILEHFAGNAPVNANRLPTLLGQKVAYAEASNLFAGPAQTGLGGTYTKITQFETVGEIKNCTVANHAITVGVSGVYRAEYSISFTGTNSTTYTIAIHVNNNEVLKTKSGRKLDLANDVGNCGSFGIGRLNAGAEVDIRVLATGSNKSFTVQAGNFELIRIR